MLCNAPLCSPPVRLYNCTQLELVAATSSDTLSSSLSGQPDLDYTAQEQQDQQAQQQKFLVYDTAGVFTVLYETWGKVPSFEELSAFVRSKELSATARIPEVAIRVYHWMLLETRKPHGNKIEEEAWCLDFFGPLTADQQARKRSFASSARVKYVNEQFNVSQPDDAVYAILTKYAKDLNVKREVRWVASSDGIGTLEKRSMTDPPGKWTHQGEWRAKSHEWFPINRLPGKRKEAPRTLEEASEEAPEKPEGAPGEALEEAFEEALEEAAGPSTLAMVPVAKRARTDPEVADTSGHRSAEQLVDCKMLQALEAFITDRIGPYSDVSRAANNALRHYLLHEKHLNRVMRCLSDPDYEVRNCATKVVALMLDPDKMLFLDEVKAGLLGAIDSSFGHLVNDSSEGALTLLESLLRFIYGHASSMDVLREKLGRVFIPTLVARCDGENTVLAVKCLQMLICGRSRNAQVLKAPMISKLVAVDEPSAIRPLVEIFSDMARWYEESVVSSLNEGGVNSFLEAALEVSEASGDQHVVLHAKEGIKRLLFNSENLAANMGKELLLRNELARSPE